MMTPRKILIQIMIIYGLMPGMYSVTANTLPPSWQGVDETVVESHARNAGYLQDEQPCDSGDLLLFFFLSAGALGGFIAGYYYHQLFSTPTHDS